MNLRDFITLILKEILKIECNLRCCTKEYHDALIIKRQAYCDLLRTALGKDNDKIMTAASILGELKAAEVDQHINNIMGVENAGRN